MSTHPEANFLHSWNWGEFHESLGHKVLRYGFYKNSKLVGVTQGVIEPARRGRHMVIVGGPILDWNDQKIVTEWRDTVKKAAADNKCIFVRLRPQLLDMLSNRANIRKLGFHKSPMHATADLTSQLNLSLSEEELKHAMRKGTRYEINRSTKLGIEVSSSNDTKDIDEFYKLQLATAQRQGFVPFSKKFLNEQFKAFAKDGKVLLYRSTYEGQLLAMAFIIFYGKEAAYHYGASTDLARKFPGAYAIQWQAIAEAKKRGCTRYNFWGITDHGQTKHRFYGVSVFKRGFGGQDVAYVPAHDLIINPVVYPLTYSFETARRKLRRL